MIPSNSLSPQNMRKQQQQQQQQQQRTTTASVSASAPASSVTSRSSTVASLRPIEDRARPVSPYSSIALSPKGNYALLAGTDTVQLISVGPQGLKRVKSCKISQHFYPSSASAAAAAGTRPTSTTRQHEPRYGDLRDAFTPHGVTDTAAAAGVATTMTVPQQYGNICVTKVAWSQSYACPPLHQPPQPPQTPDPTKTTDEAGTAAGVVESRLRSNSEATERTKRQQHGRPRPPQPPRQGENDANTQTTNNNNNNKSADRFETVQESFVAAAGSNGVVVVWRAKRLLRSDYDRKSEEKHTSGRRKKSASSSSSTAHLAKQQRRQQPEAILSQHTRAVNGLAWHPTRCGLLLTASQDGSVKLWERRAVPQQQAARRGDADHASSPSKGSRPEPPSPHPHPPPRSSWFSRIKSGVGRSGAKNGATGDSTTEDHDDDDDEEEDHRYAWSCTATYVVGEQDAVRDVKWNTQVPDVFGAVTASGNLVVYNRYVPGKAVLKIAAHTGDAASLDFHPQRPFVVATGGSADRCCKVWDLETSLAPLLDNTNTATTNNNNAAHQRQNLHDNANTWGTSKSDRSNTSAASASSSESL